MKEFCKQRGLEAVRELWRGPKVNFRPELFLDQRFCDSQPTEFAQKFDTPVPLGEDKSIVDEGVCIRIDSMVPQIYKAKSPLFLEHETKLIDQGAEDLEAEQSVTEAPDENHN